MARHTFPLWEACTACWTVDLLVYKGRALLLLFHRSSSDHKEDCKRIHTMVTGCAGYLVYLLHPLTCKHCAHRLSFLNSYRLILKIMQYLIRIELFLDDPQISRWGEVSLVCLTQRNHHGPPLSSDMSVLLQSPKKDKKKETGGSNIVGMFEQSQIQEFKEVRGQMLWWNCVCGAVLPPLVTSVTVFCWQAFTIMDQNRDGIIDKSDLRDTYAALGKDLLTKKCKYHILALRLLLHDINVWCVRWQVALMLVSMSSTRWWRSVQDLSTSLCSSTCLEKNSKVSQHQRRNDCAVCIF